MNIFDSFDKIYCINLKYRIDRRERCNTQFNNFGIKKNVDFYDAVFPSNSFLSKKQNAQLGCFLSHYFILKNAKENNYNRILILEDDFIFNLSISETNLLLIKCFDELPIDWDMFYLGGYFVKGYDYEAVVNYSKNLYKVNTAFTTHSISYSKQGITKLTKKMEDLFYNIPFFINCYESLDWFLVKDFQYSNNCFASKQFLCGQTDGFSDIENKVVDYKEYFKKSYLYS